MFALLWTGSRLPGLAMALTLGLGPPPELPETGPAPSSGPSSSPSPKVESSSETECPALEQLPARVQALLSASPLEITGVGAHVHLTKDRGQFSLALQFSTPGEQGLPVQHDAGELRGPRCAPLVDAAALLIAFEVDPLVLDHITAPAAKRKAPPVVQRAGEDPPPTPAPDPDAALAADAVEITPPPPPVEIDDPRSVTPTRSRYRLRRADQDPNAARARIALRSTLGFGVTPLLNFGLGGGASWVLRPRLALDIGARHSFRRVQTQTDAVGGIGVANTVLHARACLRGLPKVELLGCLGAEGGVLWASSNDVTPPFSRVLGWGAASASAGFRWPAGGRVALAVDAEAWIGFSRPSFKFPGVTGAYRVNRVGLRGWIGADIRFGRPVTQKRPKVATEP